MGDLGWRAQSSQLSRKSKPIEGLRDDFGLRAKAAVQAMKEENPGKTTQNPETRKGRITLTPNKGVELRNQKDLEQLETDETKELKRLTALERKAKLYESLQSGINIDDEEANDRHEVDFIAKALQGDCTGPAELAGKVESSSRPLHPEAILEQQQAIRRQMQGFSGAEYSTYEEDVAELEARHRRVDELNELNAMRNKEFEEERKKQEEREARKSKESAKHKAAVLQRLLHKRQKLKAAQ